MKVSEFFGELEAIRETPSRTRKEEIIQSLLDRDPDLTQQIFKYAMYPFWNYRVHVVAQNYPNYPALYGNYPSDSDIRWLKFVALLEDLRLGRLTGNKARDAVVNRLNFFGTGLAHWFARILNQDLDIGVAAGTIRKLMPDLLPETDPMLCEKVEPEDLANLKDKEGWLLEPKLDGLRALAFIENGQVTFVSRKGKDIFNTELIQEQLLRMGVTNAVFDGELKADDWNQTISICHTRLKHPMAHKLRFFIWDAIPLKQWNAKETSPLSERKMVLTKCFHNRPVGSDIDNLVKVPFVTITKEHNLESEMKKLVAQGYEGGVLKNPKSEYVWKRSPNWLKLKPIHECDLEVYDYQEGDGKNIGSLGALKCRGEVTFRGRVYKIDTKLGSGFSDKQRDDLWAKRKKGIIVEAKFQEVQLKKKYDPDVPHALKFGVFVRVRRDK